ncbi:MAG TPA: redoxin domain-containing protein [Gammaproteobacteria bacterium]|nr:redoxin domain-containing protein [Gammaproteobacteria bacterium]
MNAPQLTARSRRWVAGAVLLAGLGAAFIGGTRFGAADAASGSAPAPAGEMAKANPASSKSAWRKPGFELPALAGGKRSLEDYKGKVIMLNFWATWCPPCQYETRDFVRYQKRWKEAGLQIVGVGLDRERKLRNFARSFGINYPVLVTDRARGARMLGVWGDDKGILPYTVVIAPDGEIVFSHAGQFSDQLFEDFVRPLLEDGRA